VVVQESTGGEVQLNAPDRSFERFVAVEGERLRRALVASYGVDVGSDASAEALAWAWEHWARVSEMANPVGYLFRVGQSATRRHRRWRRPRVLLPSETGSPDEGEMSGRLDEALVALTERQRAVVLLVHGYDYSYAEVAEMTGASLASVRNDLHRAMKRLRAQLEAQ
jgi:RNA polymerase sigma factor (sigma-70 family)